jgi:hypothetical protein
MAHIQVIAHTDGHDGIQYRHANEIFSVDESELNDEGFPKDGRDWFSVLEKAPAPKPKAISERPPGAGPAKGSKAG